MVSYQRTGLGRFAKGNAGGPGRPRRRDEINRNFLREIERLIDSPQKFTASQREALVRLVTSFVEGSDDERAIAAASILVRMDAATLLQS